MICAELAPECNMPPLESALRVDDTAHPAGRGDGLRNGVGVALETAMHETDDQIQTSTSKGATTKTTTNTTSTTTQAIQHPSSDLVLESLQLPSPPHHAGTHSPPTSSSPSSSSSSSSPLPPPQSSLKDVASTTETKQQEQACVTAAVHDSADPACANADTNRNGRRSGMTDSVFPSEHKFVV